MFAQPGKTAKFGSFFVAFDERAAVDRGCQTYRPCVVTTGPTKDGELSYVSICCTSANAAAMDAARAMLRDAPPLSASSGCSSGAILWISNTKYAVDDRFEAAGGSRESQPHVVWCRVWFSAFVSTGRICCRVWLDRRVISRRCVSHRYRVLCTCCSKPGTWSTFMSVPIIPCSTPAC